jgi:hypothetical protein
MTTKQIIANFVNGATKGKASSVEIAGDRLYNYATVIAQRINGCIHINTTRYSMTTTKHQNVLRREMPNAPTVDDVPRGTGDLSRYIQ